MRKPVIICLLVLALVAAACGDDDSGGGGSGSGGSGAAALTVPALDDVLNVDFENCAPAPAGSPLIIGYAADQSEVGGFVDIPGSQAADLFVDMINCAGGIDGHPVEFVVQDIQGDPEVTQRAARDLLDAGAQVILGPPFADFGQPLLQVTGGDVPVLFVASTEPSLPDPAALSFLVTFDDTVQAETAARFALDQGYTRAITFSAPGPYFGYNPEVFTRAFEEGGGEVVIDETYVPFEDTDFSTQVNEVAGVADGSEILYTAMIADQLSILRGQLEAQGVDIAYLGADAFEATGIVAVDNNEGVFYTTHAWAGPGTRLKSFVDTFAAVNDSPIENSSFGGLAADAVWIAVNAFADTGGSDDPAAIGAAIAELSGLQTVTGSITYAGTDGVPAKPVYVHQILNGEPSLAATYG